jgi:hypothetical protein
MQLIQLFYHTNATPDIPNGSGIKPSGPGAGATGNGRPIMNPALGAPGHKLRETADGFVSNYYLGRMEPTSCDLPAANWIKSPGVTLCAWMKGTSTLIYVAKIELINHPKLNT